jgi:hypothetical protein
VRWERKEGATRAERASKKAKGKSGGMKGLDLGHSAYDHQGEAGRHGDRHFDFDS